MNTISKIIPREIIDSRGNPTVEVEMFLDNNIHDIASVPSGASVGSFEAHELRDLDINRYLGKGVLQAIDNINEVIATACVGKTFTSQQEFDKMLVELDGTDNKSNLGANAILATSIAFAKVMALSLDKTLYQYLADSFSFTPRRMPIPMMNILNGGIHANNNVDIQEFMIMPINVTSFKEAVRVGCEIFHHLKEILMKQGDSTSVGYEGGFTPNLSRSEEVCDLLLKATDKAQYKIGKDIVIALDVAATELYSEKDNVYNFKGEGLVMTQEELIAYYTHLINNYPIVSIEDPIAEDDYDGWRLITEELGSRCQLIGDDLFVSNIKRLHKGINENLANGILIKYNQVGTLTEALETIRFAQKSGYRNVISHRSGETEDVTVSHFSIACNSGQIKIGAPSRVDRVAKYNELMRIEENLIKLVDYEYDVKEITCFV